MKEILMFLLHAFTERPFSDLYFSCFLPLDLLPPALSFPEVSVLLLFSLPNPLVLLFIFYYLWIYFCMSPAFISISFFIFCQMHYLFPAHSTQTWVPFCFGQRFALDHPIFVSVLSSVPALIHLPWWWGQQFPLKYQYMSARLHGIHAQTAIFIKYFIGTLHALRIFFHSHVICELMHSAIRRNT